MSTAARRQYVSGEDKRRAEVEGSSSACRRACSSWAALNENTSPKAGGITQTLARDHGTRLIARGVD